eukprot:4373620-Pyramimonas_sp.AAC.1
MPSSSKEALERERADDMNRARMMALKAFLSRPRVEQKLHEALKEFKHAPCKRLRGAVADVSLQNNKRCEGAALERVPEDAGPGRAGQAAAEPAAREGEQAAGAAPREAAG